MATEAFPNFLEKLKKIIQYGKYESSIGGFPVLFANGYGCFWLLEKRSEFGVRRSEFGGRSSPPFSPNLQRFTQRSR